MNKLKTFLALVLTGVVAHSATITWSSSNITGDSSINNAGTGIYAYGGGGAATINGVSFLDYQTSGAANTTLTEFSDNAIALGFVTNGSFYTTGAFSSGLNTLLGNAALAQGNTNTSLTLGLNNLTIGQAYTINLLMSDTRVGWDNWNTTTIGSFTTPQLGGTGNTPISLLGTFTADATSQNFVIAGTHAGGGGTSAAFSAFSLRTSAVPEPSTWVFALSSLAVVGYVNRRKFSSKA